MKYWYAVYTKPNCEKLVATWLEEYAGLEVYLPEVDTNGDNKETQRHPFFPCYLFVRMDLGEVQKSKWQWTRGLRSLVSFGGQPAAIPEDIIDLLQHKLAAINTGGTVAQSTYRRGDSVRLKDGPFRDMIAVFDTMIQPEERVRVLLKAMGRYYRLNVSPDSLEKVEQTARGKRPRGTRGSRGRGRPIKREERAAHSRPAH
ncbi:MAG: transcription termination/antitermination NusG family protein [Candidatus Promineifilaceae bacterium]|nr:transcription termination/antitermination NusG family protein [Candidatus Promineifilaceae bacterium]